MLVCKDEVWVGHLKSGADNNRKKREENIEIEMGQRIA